MKMNISIFFGVLALFVIASTATSSPLVKVGVPNEIPAASNQKVNITWYLDGVEMEKNETKAYNHSWVYAPNWSQSGYHNLIRVIANQNGTVVDSSEIFAGTLFLVNGTISNNTVNATAESICVAPGNRSFNLTVFVEGVQAEFMPIGGGASDINYKASSWNILNLTDIPRNNSNSSRVVFPVRMANGTKYILSFNTTDKNGTFLFGLNKPAAETADGRKINVSVKAGEVKVSPLVDNDCSFRVDIADLNKIKLNLNKPASFCPRCDNTGNSSGSPPDGWINMWDYNNAKAKLGEIPTV